MDTATKTDLIIAGIHFAIHLLEHDILRKIGPAIVLSDAQEVAAASKWSWRKIHSKCITSADELTRVTASLYVGLQHEGDDDGDDLAIFRSVEIPEYFRSRLTLENNKKQDRDRKAVALRKEIALYRSRVYSSRIFPSSLKAIIFERDNYTCRVCLRYRATLQKNGLHLECDHIQAWDDGGLTTYKNGQTICSDCNKAKHHAKGYFGLVARLQSSGITNK